MLANCYSVNRIWCGVHVRLSCVATGSWLTGQTTFCWTLLLSQKLAFLTIYFVSLQESVVVCVQPESCVTTVVSRDGTINSTKRPISALPWRLTPSEALPTPRELYLRKCKYITTPLISSLIIRDVLRDCLVWSAQVVSAPPFNLIYSIIWKPKQILVQQHRYSVNIGPNVFSEYQ